MTTPTIRQRRERAGISQEALARSLGVSRQTVVNIENGSQPHVGLALDLARELGVTVEQLFKVTRDERKAAK